MHVHVTERQVNASLTIFHVLSMHAVLVIRKANIYPRNYLQIIEIESVRVNRLLGGTSGEGDTYHRRRQPGTCSEWFQPSLHFTHTRRSPHERLHAHEQYRSSLPPPCRACCHHTRLINYVATVTTSICKRHYTYNQKQQLLAMKVVDYVIYRKAMRSRVDWGNRLEIRQKQVAPKIGCNMGYTPQPIVHASIVIRLLRGQSVLFFVVYNYYIVKVLVW